MTTGIVTRGDRRKWRLAIWNVMFSSCFMLILLEVLSWNISKGIQSFSMEFDGKTVQKSCIVPPCGDLQRIFDPCLASPLGGIIVT